MSATAQNYVYRVKITDSMPPAPNGSCSRISITASPPKPMRIIKRQTFDRSVSLFHVNA